MRKTTLTAKQRLLIHTFCSDKDDKVRDNKTRSYNKVYDCSKMQRHVTERKAWEEFDKPHIAEYLEEFREEVRANAVVDAHWVLDKSVAMHKRCSTEKTYDAAGVKGAIELVGKNRMVNAFKENIDLTVTEGENLTPWSSVTANTDKTTETASDE